MYGDYSVIYNWACLDTPRRNWQCRLGWFRPHCIYLQKRLEEDPCWIDPHVHAATQLIKGLTCTEFTYMPGARYDRWFRYLLRPLLYTKRQPSSPYYYCYCYYTTVLSHWDFSQGKFGLLFPHVSIIRRTLTWTTGSVTCAQMSIIHRTLTWTTGSCNVRTDVHNPSNSDMDYGICNMRTDVHNPSNSDMDYGICNMRTDVRNPSNSDMDYRICNVRTDVN